MCSCAQLPSIQCPYGGAPYYHSCRGINQRLSSLPEVIVMIQVRSGFTLSLLVVTIIGAFLYSGPLRGESVTSLSDRGMTFEK